MSNQSGAIKFSSLVWLAFFVGLIYAAIKLVPPYVQDFQIANTAETAAKFYADKKAETVPAYLRRKISDMDLPVAPEDFKIQEVDGYVVVSVEWQHQVVWIPENPIVEQYQRTLTFYHEATQKLK